LPLGLTLLVAATLLPLLAPGLALLIVATLARLLAHFAALLALDLRLRSLLALLALGSRFAAAIAAAAHFGTAWSAVPAITALRDLYPLARRLCGGRGNGGQDRRSDQQPSEHLLHLALLQLMSRALETPAGMMNRFLLLGR
jgi:hypothetical protein